MTVTRIDNERWLSCDECGDDQDGQYENADFADMLVDAKAAGWTIRSGKDGYTHHCPCCKDVAPPSKPPKKAWSHDLLRRQFGK